jgi:GTP-binding protein
VKTLDARFLRGLVSHDPVLEDGTPQIAFIGRSNVGKSSLINSLTGHQGLARTSSFPGRTQQINLFVVEIGAAKSAARKSRQYWLDLPGYGYSKHSLETKRKLHGLIDWYLFQSAYIQQKVLLIIDAEVGPTDNDFEMLRSLEATAKPVLVVANKADKIRKSRAPVRWRELQKLLGHHPVVPYSSEKSIGREALTAVLFGPA